MIRIPNLAIKSYFLMAKYAIPELRRRGGGVIINTASVQGLQSQKLVPAYAASKGGIRSLTRKMALDYEAENIRVLRGVPGDDRHQMVREAAAAASGDSDAIIAQWGTTHPLGRPGRPEEIAHVVLFLASPVSGLRGATATARSAGAIMGRDLLTRRARTNGPDNLVCC